MANTNTQSRGFAAMDEKKQHDIASEGGQSQGAENNPGNFANDPERASRAGQKGTQAQPTEAKRKGAENQPREAKQRGGERGGSASRRS